MPRQRLPTGLPTRLLLFCLSASCLMALPHHLTFQPEAISDEVKAEVVTPHIPWAKPYAGGPLKALFIGPRFGHRETVEVMQRLSVQAETVLVGLVSQWDWGYPIHVPGSTQEDLLRELDRKLDAHFDVIVVGNLEWGLLPDSAVLKIFRQVAAGAGLLVCQYGNQRLPSEYRQLLTPNPDHPDFLALVPLRSFLALMDPENRPILGAPPVTECFSFRKGRVCLVDYPGVSNQGIHYLTANPNDELAYEYSQALLIKTLLWTSGKASQDFQVTGLIAPEVIASQGGPQPVHLSVSVKDGRQGGSEQLAGTFVVRDRMGKIWHETSFPCPAKFTAPLQLPLPELPGEGFFADVIFRRGEAVVDWASTAFRVLSQETIQDIALFRDVLYPEEKLSGRVVTSRVPREDEEIRLTLTDGWGRRFAELKLPDPKFGDVLPVRSPMYVVFEWPVADSLSTVNRVRAEWRSNGRVLAFMERDFFVPRRKEGDFYTGVWSATERVDQWGWLLTQLFQRERALGIDAGLIGHVYANPPKGMANGLGMARAGLAPFPYIDRIGYYGTSRERVPCLSDPSFRRQRGAELRSWAWEFRKTGCVGYNFGDEANLSINSVDVCVAPSTLKVYREWLTHQYGSLEALNTEYGSSFRSWEEVFPLTRREAGAKGNQASWIDHKVFMANVMADYIAAMQNALRESDPLARAGCEGIWGTSPDNGFEWTALAEKAGVMIPYTDEALAVEAIRSFAKPGTLTGIWTGGYSHIAMYEWKSRYSPWYSLLHGMNTAWFYADYDGTTMSHPMLMLSHDFTLNRAGRWFCEEIDLIKRGIGKLILNAQRRNDPVALLYSQASGFLTGNHADEWIAVLEDAGLQFGVIARRDLESEKGLADYRALVLPETVSLSEAEQKQIRAFVERGGTVIADILPGDCDAHGKKYARNPLMDLFGVAENQEAAKGKFQLKRASETVEVFKAGGATAKAETQRGAKLGDKGDALLIAGSGQGRALLLNFGLDGYVVSRDQGKRRNLPALIGNFLKFEGDAQREAIPGLERMAYDIPGAEIYAFLLRDTEQENKTVAVQPALGSGKLVFDMVGGKELGPSGSLKLGLTPGRPTILSVLSKQPANLTARCEKLPDNNRFRIVIAQENRPFNVIHLTIAGPDGKLRDCYAQNLLMKDGGAQTVCYLGENAAPGVWTVLLREILSGKAISLKLDVARK